MAEALGHALVVGGTGMLTEATRAIAARASALTLVARRPEGLARELGAQALALDWTERAAARAALAGLVDPFDLAVIWLHDHAVWGARACEDLLRPGARVIRVHGARSADPAVRSQREPDPRPGLRRQTVILGWHPDADAPEGRRWLDHREISGGVLRALDRPDEASILVGTRAG